MYWQLDLASRRFFSFFVSDFFRFQSMFLKCDVLCVSLFCPTAEFYGASASLRIWGGSWVSWGRFGSRVSDGSWLVPISEGFGKAL